MTTKQNRRLAARREALRLFGQLTEDELGEMIRAACDALGWRFLWLRHTFNSSEGILDLILIPLRNFESRHILHRELKGYDARGNLGRLTLEQVATIEAINAAGGDAAMWSPRDWQSDRILNELQ